ncbi:MAG: hypothetical protein ACFFAY_15635 [Promethearchaeota archaeon]
MTDTAERAKFLHAIKKCLSDAHGFFQDAMDELDEIGKGSVGTAMTPLVGGYAMKDPEDNYRVALIKLDAAEKAMQPLARRIKDGRVNDTHFKKPEALVLLKDLIELDYQILVEMLAERRGRESVWYRLKELSDKTESIFHLVAEN